MPTRISQRAPGMTAAVRCPDPRTGRQPGESPADDRERAVIGQRFPRDDRQVGILEEFREPSPEAKVLADAVGTEPLGPLGRVLATGPAVSASLSAI
jgi:hypothetical protein